MTTTTTTTTATTTTRAYEAGYEDGLAWDLDLFDSADEITEDGWDTATINALSRADLYAHLGIPAGTDWESPVVESALADYCRGCKAGALAPQDERTGAPTADYHLLEDEARGASPEETTMTITIYTATATITENGQCVAANCWKDNAWSFVTTDRAELDDEIEAAETYAAERGLAPLSIDVEEREVDGPALGARVEGGDIADDYDTGTIQAHRVVRGQLEVLIAWDSGVKTWDSPEGLRAEGERPIG